MPVADSRGATGTGVQQDLAGQVDRSQSARLICGFLRTVDGQQALCYQWSQIWSHFVFLIFFSFIFYE
jgi:hypothetical protein